jgi:hypothetical protein
MMMMLLMHHCRQDRIDHRIRPTGHNDAAVVALQHHHLIIINIIIITTKNITTTTIIIITITIFISLSSP